MFEFLEKWWASSVLVKGATIPITKRGNELL